MRLYDAHSVCWARPLLRALPALALILSWPATAQDHDRYWHLLTITHGGTVTLLKELTKHECEFAMHRALGEPATDEEIARAKAAAEEARRQAELREEEFAKTHPICRKKWSDVKPSDTDYMQWMQTCGIIGGGGWMSRMSSPGDIKSAECFQ